MTLNIFSYLLDILCGVFLGLCFLFVVGILKYSCFIMTFINPAQFIYFQFVGSFGFFYILSSSAHNAFFLFLVILHFISCVIAQIKMPASPFFTPDLRESFQISSLSVMIAIWFLQVFFFQFKDFPFYLQFTKLIYGVEFCQMLILNLL